MTKSVDKNPVHLLMLNLFQGTDSLARRMGIEEAELEFSVVVKGLGDKPIPFGVLILSAGA